MANKYSIQQIQEHYKAFTASSEYESICKKNCTKRLSESLFAIEDFIEIMPSGVSTMIDELCTNVENAMEEVGFIMGFQYACNLLNKNN